MGIGVDGHEEIGAPLVGEVGPLAQRHEDVRAPAERDLDAEPLLDHAGGPARHVEHDILLHDPRGADGPGVVAAVARVHHDELERGDAAVGLGGALACALLGAVDVDDDPEGILERGGLDIGRPALEHDLEEGVRSRRLETHLLDEPVIDLLHAEGGHGQAGQAHTNFLLAGGDQIGQLGPRLDDDAREGRVRAVAQLFGRHARVDALEAGPALHRRHRARRRDAGSELAEPLGQEAFREEPTLRGDTRGRFESEGFARDGQSRLVPGELRRAPRHGQGGARALHAPRALEQAREPLGGDIRAAIVEADHGQLTERARSALYLKGGRARGRRALDGNRSHKDRAHEEQRCRPSCHRVKPLRFGHSTNRGQAGRRKKTALQGLRSGPEGGSYNSEWWRRWASNPRPEILSNRHLHP